METKKPIYITTTLPYMNSDPHVGFAMEIIRADTMARFFRLMGHEVFFNTGSDEHGQKIYDKACEAGEDVQSYIDRYADKFKGLQQLLHLSEDLHFIRTTDKQHVRAAQELWIRCRDAGFIYKKEFTGEYCVGCELFIPYKDQDDGKCRVHPFSKLMTISEENYFFKFSAFTEQLLELYANNPDFVRPDFRLNEIKMFVEQGLEDFSVSRLKEKMQWGVPVPDDSDHVMYVWFDALTSYISTLGWPEDTEGLFEKFWQKGTTIQYAGKDNLRQQSAMWQAMLLSVGLPPTHNIVINGFIVSGGQKMSKSVGNVLSPYTIVEMYGAEALRYYLLRHVQSFEDSDMTMEKFNETYHAHLVHGVGNLTNRVLKMAETHLEGVVPEMSDQPFPEDWVTAMRSFDIQKVADIIWRKIGDMDERITHSAPFRLVKEDPEAGRGIMRDLVVDLHLVAKMLQPLMPQTSDMMQSAIKEMKKPTNPLFAPIEM